MIVFFIIILILFLAYYFWKIHLFIDFPSFFKRGFVKLDNAHGTYCYCGKQGSGKTYSSIKFIIDMKLKHGYTIITNEKSFNVFPDTIYIKNIYDIIDLILNLPTNLQTNYIIFFDEIFSVLEKSPKLTRDIKLCSDPLVKDTLITLYTQSDLDLSYIPIYIELIEYIKNNNINNIIYTNFINKLIKWISENGTFGLPGLVLGLPDSFSSNDLQKQAFEVCDYLNIVLNDLIVNSTHLNYYHKTYTSQKEILSFISQLRKRHIILVTTAQEWLEINVTFRRYVRYQIDCNMISMPLSKKALVFNYVNDGYALHWDNLENEYIAPRLRTIIRKGNKSIIDSYDTFETIDTN